MKTWSNEVDPLYDAATIGERVRSIGAQITRDFAGHRIVLVGVLKGSFVFYADLVRAIDLPQDNDFISISSYGDNTESSGVVKLTSDLSINVENRHMILVEDIIDTGLSMRYLLRNLSTRKPASLSVCTLLNKPENRRCEIPIDYCGFVISNAFVVGYGLDYAQMYRNLPYIGVYRGASS